MPRYHFDLMDGTTIAEEGGADLPDDVRAMDAAGTIAKQLLRERPDLKNRRYSILVTNEDGDEICRVPLDIVH